MISIKIRLQRLHTLCDHTKKNLNFIYRKFVGCAMEVVFDMELNDAITAKEEDVKSSVTKNV